LPAIRRPEGLLLHRVQRRSDYAGHQFDPITRKIVGTTDQQQAMAVKRLDIREIMGSKLMREITLK